MHSPPKGGHYVPRQYLWCPLRTATVSVRSARPEPDRQQCPAWAGPSTMSGLSPTVNARP